jgi:hypothetical protein
MVISSAGAWPLVSVRGVYRVTGAPARGALALPAQEAGDVVLKLKTKKPTLRSSRNTIRGSWYFIKNFISQE